MSADNYRPKTPKTPYCKSYIGIIMFGGACFFVKAYRAKVLSFNERHIFLSHLKMSVLRLWCLQTYAATTIDAIKR